MTDGLDEKLLNVDEIIDTPDNTPYKNSYNNSNNNLYDKKIQVVELNQII